MSGHKYRKAVYYLADSAKMMDIFQTASAKPELEVLMKKPSDSEFTFVCVGLEHEQDEKLESAFKAVCDKIEKDNPGIQELQNTTFAHQKLFAITPVIKTSS